MTGVGVPVAVTVKLTLTPAPGDGSVTVMSAGTVMTGAVWTVIVNESVSEPPAFVALQSTVCTPAAKVSPLETGVTPSTQAIVGVGVPSAVTVKLTGAPAPGDDSVTVMFAG